MVKVCHTYREGNHATDYLASIGYDYLFGSHTIFSSDCNLGYLFHYDYMDISEPHSIIRRSTPLQKKLLDPNDQLIIS
ncbi:hypothetical protein LINPERPRIM_LOCUS18069 [Linum perenne]